MYKLSESHGYDDYGPDSDPTLPEIRGNVRAIAEANGKWLRSQQIGAWLRERAREIVAIDSTWTPDDVAEELILLAERIEAGETLADEGGRT